MNKIEIKPSTENVLNMLEKDAIGRNKYVTTFIEMLDNIDDNFTIFINGDWGTGKTFFVKQVSMLLTYYNQYINSELEEYFPKLDTIVNNNTFKDLKVQNNFVPIYYNAWNNDSHIDPINSIIFNIIKEHNILKDYQKETSNLIDKIAGVLDMVNIWSNGSIKELVTSFKKQDIIPEITTMEQIKETLNVLLDKLLEERGDKLVIFIDELDRCNPVYAIKLLERIKHFFEHENIIFVFSVNEKELINTISKYYGQRFDSYRYLNKFYDLSIDLPRVDIVNFMESLGFTKDSDWHNLIIFEIIRKYHFSMRDCIRYYQSISIVENLINTQFRHRFKEEKGIEIIKYLFLPLLLGIKVIDLKTYVEIISGNGYNKCLEIIDKIEVVKEILPYYMDKDESGNVSKESFNNQFLKIYNAIFNNKGESYKEYSNSEIELNSYAYNYLIEALSLIKKGFKY